MINIPQTPKGPAIYSSVSFILNLVFYLHLNSFSPKFVSSSNGKLIDFFFFFDFFHLNVQFCNVINKLIIQHCVISN